MGVGSQRHVPAAFSTGKNAGTYCRGGWVGPRVGLDGHEDEKTFALTGVRNPNSPVHS
jgi:hypothetical protein